jgi:hypothetical protein
MQLGKHSQATQSTHGVGRTTRSVSGMLEQAARHAQAAAEEASHTMMTSLLDDSDLGFGVQRSALALPASSACQSLADCNLRAVASATGDGAKAQDMADIDRARLMQAAQQLVRGWRTHHRQQRLLLDQDVQDMAHNHEFIVMVFTDIAGAALK